MWQGSAVSVPELCPALFKTPENVLLPGLSTYFHSGVFADLTVIAPNGKRMPCHQLVLSAGSKRFARILEPEHQTVFGTQVHQLRTHEGSTGSHRAGWPHPMLLQLPCVADGPAGIQTTEPELPVWGVDSDALEAVVACFYTGECQVDLATVVPILDAAQRLEVVALKSFCEQYIASIAQPSNCLTLATQAMMFKMEPLVEAMVQTTQGCLPEVAQSPGFLTCSFPLLAKVISMNRPHHLEEQLFRATWAWLLAVPSHQDHLNDVVSLVTLPVNIQPSDMLNRDMAQRFGLALPWPLLPSGQPGMNSDMPHYPPLGHHSNHLGQRLGSKTTPTGLASNSLRHSPASAQQRHTPGLDQLLLPGGTPFNSQHHQQQQQWASPMLGQPLLQDSMGGSSLIMSPELLTAAATRDMGPPGSCSGMGSPSAPVPAPSSTPFTISQPRPPQGHGGASAWSSLTPELPSGFGSSSDPSPDQLPALPSLAPDLLTQLQGTGGAAGGLAGPVALGDPALAFSSPPNLNSGHSMQQQQWGALGGVSRMEGHALGPPAMMAPGTRDRRGAGSQAEGRGGEAGEEEDGDGEDGEGGQGGGHTGAGGGGAPGVGGTRVFRSSGARQGPNKGTCQVEGCGEELATLRDYHQRYKICEFHLKKPFVIKDGIQQRFCQQCGRFQPLSEFEGIKRSCRARLQRHNDRRRKRADDEFASQGAPPPPAGFLLSVPPQPPMLPLSLALAGSGLPGIGNKRLRDPTPININALMLQLPRPPLQATAQDPGQLLPPQPANNGVQHNGGGSIQSPAAEAPNLPPHVPSGTGSGGGEGTSKEGSATPPATGSGPWGLHMLADLANCSNPPRPGGSGEVTAAGAGAEAGAPAAGAPAADANG
ncbi:hypothetical protein QJQ45_020003, partial [Haematococcus lacustris]